MSAILTGDEVEKIAKLAKLTLSDEEKARYAAQLSGILEFVSKLQKVKPDKATHMTHITGLINVFREDVVDTSRQLTQKQALANAKATYKGYFKVPGVFDK